MKKLTSRQKKAIETKMKITKTAMDLFLEKGYHQVTIREICKLANFSVGAFYHHFSTKEELLSIGQESIDMMIIDELYDTEYVGTTEEILHIINHTSNKLETFGIEFLTAAYAEILRQRSPYVISEERTYFKFLLEIVTKGIQNGYIRHDLKAKQVSKDILRFTRGAIYDWCLKNGNAKLSEVVATDVKMYLESIRNRTHNME